MAVRRSPRGNTVGIRDVAALAGVSPGTASKALNGRGQLREETRERVRAAARQPAGGARVLRAAAPAD